MLVELVMDLVEALGVVQVLQGEDEEALVQEEEQGVALTMDELAVPPMDDTGVVHHLGATAVDHLTTDHMLEVTVMPVVSQRTVIDQEIFLYNNLAASGKWIARNSVTQFMGLTAKYCT